MTTPTRYVGAHRAEAVGSLRYSDADCLASERASIKIADRIAVRRTTVRFPVCHHVDCGDLS